MTFSKNFYLYIFLFFFIIIGANFSIHTGVTHDETYDYNVWIANKNYILNFLFGYNLDTTYLSGGGKFYGSGFHYLSSLLEFFTVNLPQLSSYDVVAKEILSKHISVFLLFVVSGLVFRKILKIIINDYYFVNLSTVFYLLYPYLLGHSFFNVKDIPFLTFWLICSYFIIRISKNYLKKNIILKKHIFFLSIFTGYLLSIRISGILIFIQYFIFILMLSNDKKFNLIVFLKRIYKEAIIATFLIFFIYIILQPGIWSNPLLIFDAIKYMSSHIQSVCTLTLGECMKAQDLPASYLFIWIFFKLPIVILIGLILYFYIEKKIENSFNNYIIISLIFSISSIIVLLILFNVNLYDEIRQVMFLIPLIFIISLTSLNYFSKRVFSILINFFIIYFIFQNIFIYPYNYIWINNFSHFSKINKVFELDYWGASTKKVASVINQNRLNVEACLITNRNDALELLLPGDKCLIEFKNLHQKQTKPFYVALFERGINKGVPNNCRLFFEEKKRVNFSNEKLTLAKIYKCD